MIVPIPMTTMNGEPDSPIRVVVVQRDSDAAEALFDLLERDGGFQMLEHCRDVASAGFAVRSHAPELVIADAHIAAELRAVLEFACLEPAPVKIFMGPGPHGDVPTVAVSMLAEGACLELALERAKAEVQRRRLCALRHRLDSQAAPNSAQRVRRFAVRTDDRIVFVRPEEIDWIQAAWNYVRLHVGEASYPIRLTMSRMELLLPTDGFMRVHRNAIVNLDRVLEFQIPSAGNICAFLRNGKRLPLSRGYRGDLRAFLCRSLGVPCFTAAPELRSGLEGDTPMVTRRDGNQGLTGASAALH